MYLCLKNVIKLKMFNDSYCIKICLSNFTLPKNSNLWDLPVYHTKLTIGISDATMYKTVMVLRAIQLNIFLFAIVLFIMV